MFSGIQGEGPYVGVRQVFVRFGGCDLRCSWCDTPRSLVRRDPARVEISSGRREFEILANPLSIQDATGCLVRLSPGDHHSVSFTGGEPLLQPASLLTLADIVHRSGSLVFLETYGGRVEELEQVINDVDIVSMDIKLKSSTGEDVSLDRHATFLEIAMKKEAYVKIVVTPDTAEAEIIAATRMVSGISRSVPLVLQPVTPMGRIKGTPTPERMLALQQASLAIHGDVRVIPQVHALMGQM